MKKPSLSRYQKIRSETENFCKQLKAEDHLAQPVYFVSPPKWVLGHTSWFFEEMILKPFSRDYAPFHPGYSYFFNSYYNTMGDRVFRADRGNMTRPTLEDVYAYRKHVDEGIKKILQSVDRTDEFDYIFELGLNHEQQHQELLHTDVKYILALNPLFPAIFDNAPSSNMNQQEGWIQLTGGLYDIGFAGNDFCFDNERERHTVYINDFEINKALVTNGEYLEFMASKGYENFNLWLDEGWAWIQKNGIKAPLYWHLIDGEWFHYTLAGLEKVKAKEILCHISFYEAAAFAEWKNLRLPTEFEWEVAADHLSWGSRWEWTYSAYLPYPKFRKSEGAAGEYNGKFMINQMVLRGASVATSPGHSRKTYRNFFHPDTQWQFSGIRLVRNSI